jgi:hypothetical protein
MDVIILIAIIIFAYHTKLNKIKKDMKNDKD